MAEPDGAKGGGRLGIFGDRGFVDYFLSYISSRAAFQVANVGLVWAVYAITKSAIDLAVVGVANTVVTLIVTLPAGVWIDRFDRIKLYFLSNAVSTACLVALAYFGTGPGFSLLGIVAVIVPWAAAGELYRSTSYAVVPELVPAESLSNANGIAQSGLQVATAMSAVLGGGLIVAAGVLSTYVFGVAGYAFATVFSAALLRRSKPKPKPEGPAPAPRQGMAREIGEGFRWLLTQRGLLWLSILALVFNFLFGIPTYFIVIYVRETLHASAFYYAAILAVFLTGMAAGSLLAGRLPRVLAYAGKVNILAWGFIGGAFLALMGAVPVLSVALLASAGMGSGIGFGVNVWLTAAQGIVPAEMRGRYFAIDGLLSFVGGPPSIAVGGVLIALTGITNVFLLSGGLILAFSVMFVFVKSLWVLDGRAKGAVSAVPQG